jgi:hypothetical protein
LVRQFPKPEQQVMVLSRIILRLARNPGTEFANGDDRYGYTLVAPLDAKGFLDEAAWKANKEACTVRHFSPEFDEPHNGRLRRRGDNWFFDYEEESTEDDEPVFKLGGHPFLVGEYVTVTDEDGRPLTYHVTDVGKA